MEHGQQPAVGAARTRGSLEDRGATIALTDERARDLLRAIASTIRSYSLYPPGHPIREDNLGQVVSTATALLEKLDSFDIFIHEDSFFLGDKLLPKESLTMQWLMRDWQQKKIRSISIARGASRDEISDLLEYLAESGPRPKGRATVNSAQLREHMTAAETRGKLRVAYSSALDILRDTGIGVIDGKQLRLTPARQAVDGLIDTVLTDPSSALLLTTMRSHDEYTFFHMINVCILSLATGVAIGLERDHLTTLGLGAILHDIGKVAVPPEVLNRSGPLSENDWEQIRRHPVDGAQVILNSWGRISPMAAVIAYEHHHRLDGTGYPAVPLSSTPDLLSRIVSVADTFDAITSRRAYRRAEQRQRALDVLMSGAGGHYDGRVVNVFIRMLGFHPPGSIVELDDGSIAVVVRNNPDVLNRPILKIVRSPRGNPVSPRQLDLSAPRAKRQIVRTLDQDRAGIDPSELV